MAINLNNYVRNIEKENVRSTVDKTVTHRNGVVSTGKSNVTKRMKKKQSEMISTQGIFRNVPRSIISSVTTEFPNARTQTDALVAYLMCYGSDDLKTRLKAELTPEQEALITSWCGSDRDTLGTTLNSMNKQIKKIHKELKQFGIISAYGVFDKLGFVNDIPDSPDDVRMDRDSFLDFLIQMSAQAIVVDRERSSITEKK